MSTDTQIESEIQAKGLTAPRVTPEQVEAAIVGETFTVLPNGRTTVCQLTLDNGFTVEGLSACVCVENFDAEIGNRIARQNAVSQVWQLLGFRLRDQLAYNPRTLHRDAATGKLVTEDYAAANPSTTVREVR